MARIRVLYINPSVSEQQVRSVFQAFGEIQTLSMIGPLHDSRTRNAIIWYHDRRAAARAVEKMNNADTVIGKLDVSSFDLGGLATSNAYVSSGESSYKPRNEQTLILVKNFKDLIDEKKLEELFGTFGEIKSLSIKKNNGKSMGYGFVDFAEHKTAVKAISFMNGYIIKGRKLEVDFVQRKEQRTNQCSNNAKTSSDAQQKQSFVIYISNLHKSVTEKQLVELFHNFGKILSVSMKEPHAGKSTTVGFVSFENQADALNAILSMDGQTVSSLPIKIVFKHDK